MPGFLNALMLAGTLIGSMAAVPTPALAVTAVLPAGDDDVAEVLPTVTRNRSSLSRPPSAGPTPGDASLAMRQAREAISVARQTGDTRYWGRAQAALSPWWDVPDAPADLAVLQATVQQGRHEFGASRAVLTAALARAPGHPQGWLNLAALERLSARYAESLAACAAVERAGQAFYAQVCRLETESLQGQQTSAAEGLRQLVDRTRDAGQRSWLLSVLAEALERAGRDTAAATAYSASLAAEHDLYTSIALSDLLLRTQKPAQALEVLSRLPETDAVVLRRAAAWKRMGDARWGGQRQLLAERVEELKRRGDDPTLHGRELALTALWLDDDPARALQLATQNLRLQREPVDWWVAAQSAKKAGRTAELMDLQTAIQKVGLHDVRLAAVFTPAPGVQR